MKSRTIPTNMPTLKSSVPPGPTPDQIRQRALEIVAARGGAPGVELEDWLQAEIELKYGLELRVGNVGN